MPAIFDPAARSHVIVDASTTAANHVGLHRPAYLFQVGLTHRAELRWCLWLAGLKVIQTALGDGERGLGECPRESSQLEIHRSAIALWLDQTETGFPGGEFISTAAP